MASLQDTGLVTILPRVLLLASFGHSRRIYGQSECLRYRAGSPWQSIQATLSSTTMWATLLWCLTRARTTRMYEERPTWSPCTMSWSQDQQRECPLVVEAYRVVSSVTKALGELVLPISIGNSSHARSSGS